MESSSILPKSVSPYDNDSINLFYNLLFCDNIDLFHIDDKQSSNYPWKVLLLDKIIREDLLKIVNDPNAESRYKILAWNKLNEAGQGEDTKELLGVIIEVALEEGLDVLAAYKDGSARYINYSGKIIIWDQKDEQSGILTSTLFSESANVINQIGPWEEARKPFPLKGNVRLSFLVSDGLYFGEGPMNAMFADEMAAPVLNTAAELMGYLTEMALNSENSK